MDGSVNFTADPTRDALDSLALVASQSYEVDRLMSIALGSTPFSSPGSSRHFGQASLEMIARVEAGLVSVKRRLNGSSAMLPRGYNAVLPVMLLPPELVVMIVKFLVDGRWPRDRLRELMAITHVCSQWRAILHTQPRFWAAHVGQYKSPDFFWEMVKRACEHPLTIEQRGGWFGVPGHYWELLNQPGRKLHALDLNVDLGSVLSLTSFFISRPDVDVTRLKLAAECRPGHCVVEDVVPMQLLCHLYLLNVFVPFRSPVLVSLALCADRSWPENLAFAWLSDVLVACTSLESLALSGWRFVALGPGPIIHLPRLRQFVAVPDFDGPSHIDLCRRLSLPALESFAFVSMGTVISDTSDTVSWLFDWLLSFGPVPPPCLTDVRDITVEDELLNESTVHLRLDDGSWRAGHRPPTADESEDGFGTMVPGRGVCIRVESRGGGMHHFDETFLSAFVGAALMGCSRPELRIRIHDAILPVQHFVLGRDIWRHLADVSVLYVSYNRFPRLLGSLTELDEGVPLLPSLKMIVCTSAYFESWEYDASVEIQNMLEFRKERRAPVSLKMAQERQVASEDLEPLQVRVHDSSD